MSDPQQSSKRLTIGSRVILPTVRKKGKDYGTIESYRDDDTAMVRTDTGYLIPVPVGNMENQK